MAVYPYTLALFRPDTHCRVLCKQSIAQHFRCPKNAASAQRQHCLLTGISLQNTDTMNHTTGTPKDRNSLIQMIRMESTGQKKKMVKHSLDFTDLIDCSPELKAHVGKGFENC